MTRLVELCAADALAKGEMMAVEVAGLPPLAVYNVEGEFFVTSNLCTHAIAMLTDGYLDGDVIECPLHGGAFDVRTGAVVSAPCEAPLKTYETKVRDGGVCVVVEELQS